MIVDRDAHPRYLEPLSAIQIKYNLCTMDDKVRRGAISAGHRRRLKNTTTEPKDKP